MSDNDTSRKSSRGWRTVVRARLLKMLGEEPPPPRRKRRGKRRPAAEAQAAPDVQDGLQGQDGLAAESAATAEEQESQEQDNLKRVHPLDVPVVDFTGARERFYRELGYIISPPAREALVAALGGEETGLRARVRERGVRDLLANKGPYSYVKINHGFWNELVFAMGANPDPRTEFERHCARFYANKTSHRALAISGYGKYVASGFALKLRDMMQEASTNAPDSFWVGLGLDNGVRSLDEQLDDVDELTRRNSLSGVGKLTALSFLLAERFLSDVNGICSSNLPRASVTDEESRTRLLERVMDEGVVVVAPASTLEKLADLDITRIELPPANGYAQDVYYNADVYTESIIDRIMDGLGGRPGFAVVEGGPLATYIGAFCRARDIDLRYLDFGLATVTLFDQSAVKGNWMRASGALRPNKLR